MRFKVDLNGCLNEIKNYNNEKIIIIPDNVKFIPEYFFSHYFEIEEIVLPLSVRTFPESIFSSCYFLEIVKLNGELEKIPEKSFEDCWELKVVNIPSSVKIIGKSAFSCCESLKEIELPSNVEKIKEYSFNGCKSLEKIIIPFKVTEIEEGVFEGCCSLKEIILPEKIKKISTRAFFGCHELEKINIPNNLKKIEKYSFYNCYSLKEIKLPESIEEIEANAFFGCRSLKLIIGNVTLDIPKILKVFPNINLSLFLKDKERLLELEKRADYFDKKGIVIQSEVFNTYERFIDFTNKSFDKFVNLLKQITKEKDNDNLWCLCKLVNNMGLLEADDVTIKLKGIDVPVNNVSFEVLQKAFKNGYLEFNDMHRRFSSMKIGDYNEEFLKFMTDKTNLTQLEEYDKIQIGVTAKVYEWFNERKYLDLNDSSNTELEPTEEKNRYKLAIYESSSNDIDRLKWRKPTVELLKKEFSSKKFFGITRRTKTIGKYLEKFSLYEQKHFEKAVEIDDERRNLGVKDHLTEKIVKENLFDSIENYRSRTQNLADKIIKESCKTLKSQTDITSKIFTYEMLAKSDKANFAMGFLTSCCATLYGAGSGAQRAMIIHSDMQPLVIKDIRENIIAFGIVYVNREKGYAVVNDFEVNQKYEDTEERKEIYIKAMQGVNAFVNQYNQENKENQIDIVTCGVSPNWVAINDYIEENPKSEILSAPNFDDFKYVGSGSWSGDWHNAQYVIWENKEKKIKRFS